MKYIPEPVPVLELSRRNLEVLLAKLDDPESVCTLVDPSQSIVVRAVENEEHYSDRQPGPVWLNNTIT